MRILAVIRVLTEHITVENSRLQAGLEPIKAFCSDLRSEVELDHLNSTGIENRAIGRAIDMRFVGCYSTVCLKPFEEGQSNSIYPAIRKTKTVSYCF